MSNALAMFDSSQFKVPAHIKAAFGGKGNIAERVTVPAMLFEGKQWTISLNGEQTALRRQNEEGDWEPISTMRVIVLDYARRRGRALYASLDEAGKMRFTAYNSARPGKPLCWSNDGIRPHATIEAPQHPACDGCPFAVKGSRINEQGKATIACSQHRMLAVIPHNKPEFTPLRMKLAITSDYDGQSPDLEAAGWFAFSNYTEFLRKKGVDHTAALVTKMQFDPNTPYPKIVFSPDRWLSQAESDVIEPIANSEGVKKLISGAWTPAGGDGVATSAPPPREIPVEDPVEELVMVEAPKPVKRASQKPAPEIAAKTVPAARSIPASDEDGDFEAPVIPAKKAQKAATPKLAAPIPTDVPDDMNDLLTKWEAGED